MTNTSTRNALHIVVAILAVCLIQFSHARLLDLVPEKISDHFSSRLVPPPNLAKALSLGFDRVLADYYWLIFTQYYGDSRVGADKFHYAPAYLNLILTLDPHFKRAYWFAAFVLAGDMASQSKHEHNFATMKKNLSQAKDILDEGIKANPQDWTIPWIAGFSQYLFAKDYKLAGYYYKMGSKKPGAPDWLGRFASIMESGAAKDIFQDAKTWAITYSESKDSSVKEHARGELQRIWSRLYYMGLDKKMDYMVTQAKSHLELFGADLLPRAAVEEDLREDR